MFRGRSLLNLEKKQHVVWSGWRETGVQTVLLIIFLFLRVETSVPCPRPGKLWSWPETFSINRLPLILVQDGELYTVHDHWASASPDFMIRRNNPILLGILSKLRKRLPPADGESHVVTLCTSSQGSAHKQKVTNLWSKWAYYDHWC